MKKIMMIALLALTVVGCAMSVADRPQPHFTYKQYPATPLGVATIEVVEEYAMPSNTPNVEHLMPQPLPGVVAEWARTRFQAGGADGHLIITIKDASIVEKGLPTTKGVKGWVTVDQAQRYDGKIAIEFRLDGTALGSSGSGAVNVSRGMTVAENISIQERDRTWNQIEQDMLTDLDANTQQMLRNRLPFLIK